MKGTTLFELLIVMSLFVLITAFGAWYYKHFYSNTQFKANANMLTSTLTFTRNMALRSHRQTQVHITTLDVSILIDDRVLLTQHLAGNKIYLRKFPKTRNDLMFNPDGTTDNGTIWQCDAMQKPAWALIVNKMGRVRKAKSEEVKQLSCIGI